MAATKSGKKETVEKRETAKSGEKKGAIELIGGTFNDGIKYLEKNLKPLFVDILKIEVLSLAVLFVVGAIAIAPWFIFSEASAGATESLNIPVILISIVVLLIAMFLTVAIGSVQYNAVDRRAKNSVVAILSQARENFVPVIGYYIVLMAIAAVLFLPSILLFISGNPAMMLGAFALVFLALLVLFVAGFLLQFGMWELVVGRRGVVGSIKKSYALVTRGNIIKTLLFNICFFVASFGFGLIFSVLNWIVQMVASLFSLINAELGLAAAVVATLVTSAVEGAIVGAVLLPFVYIFWKKLEALSG